MTTSGTTTSVGTRWAWLVLAGALLAVLGPLAARGQVLFPHDNAIEVGLASQPKGLWNRKFNDQSSVYVPAIHEHLNGDASGWIATWNPHPELGRPTFQLAGESKAFPITHALSLFTSDAFRLYTWQTFLAVIASVLFAFLLLRELQLHVAACLAGALAAGLGLFPLYWLTFVLFLWGTAWTLAIFWLAERILRKELGPRAGPQTGAPEENGSAGPGTGPEILGLAFATWCLLLTAYPQTVIWHVYLGLVFVVWRIRVHRRAARAEATSPPGRLGGTWLRLVAGAALGGAAALPVYLDLAENAARSSRLGAEASFFLDILPRFESLHQASMWFLQRFDGTWFGNPASHTSPADFNGLSLTPLVWVLFVASLAFLRRFWAAWLFVGVCVLMTLWPPAYAFGIEYLGLHVSRTNPLAAAWLPALLLGVLTADRLLRASATTISPRQRLTMVAGWLTATGLVLAAAFGTKRVLDPTMVGVSATLWLGASLFLWRPRPWLLVGLSLASALWLGHLLPLARARADIRTSSPFVELLREQTADGARYALLESGFGMTLPSNQEGLLGLQSVHTYNSISSRGYQAFVESLSPKGTKTYGRHFTHVPAPDLPDARRLSRAGVRGLVSSRELPPALAVRLSRNPNGGGAWRTVLPPLFERVLGPSRFTADDSAASDDEQGTGNDLRLAADVTGRLAPDEREATRETLHDDHLRFTFSPTESGELLFVSQQHHPRWRAQDQDGIPLETAVVDDVYLGVPLPEGTSAVELTFEPFVRWAWIPQAAFALWAVGLFALRTFSRTPPRGRSTTREAAAG